MRALVFGTAVASCKHLHSRRPTQSIEALGSSLWQGLRWGHVQPGAHFFAWLLLPSV